VRVGVADRYIDARLHLGHLRPLEGFYAWSPGNPNLYDLRMTLRSADHEIDALDTYFGMRKVQADGQKITINNKVLYQRLILDQGYWPDGLLTAPSDEALKRDVELTLAMGYNGARKHQKFEDPRYLYWADKLGLLVWGELPSAYWLTPHQKTNMLRDISEAIARDYSHPSLIAWVPINESWGVPFIRTNKEAQALADMLYAAVKSLDGTRYVSGNDGWEQASTDVVTVHDYTPFTAQLSAAYDAPDAPRTGAPNQDRYTQAQGYDHAGKPMLLTEYGGIALAKDAKHAGDWGYHGAEQSEESFLKRFEDITAGFQRMENFVGYCYTQLTDVFQEVNGLLDMERNPKVPLEEIRKINLGNAL
jgi:beta-galactosidase/beta-glucuronidase